MLKSTPPPPAITVEDATPKPSSPTSIQISYANPSDSLDSVTVSTFTGANVLRTVGEGEAEASIVRFDGGVPVWTFHAEKGFLNPIGGLRKSPHHIDNVEYGKLPGGFTQDQPESGSPPPLEPGGYYIFAIKRASGAMSYQAVRVNSDFSLQAFDAEPRAGTSYKLCCNVGNDFAQPTSDNGAAVELPSPPADQSSQP